MNARRAHITRRITVEKRGWEFRNGWWRVPGAGVARDVIDYLAPRQNVEWFYRVESELLSAGWVFAFAGGLYLAHNRNTGQDVTAVARKETLALAYLEMEGLRVGRA